MATMRRPHDGAEIRLAIGMNRRLGYVIAAVFVLAIPGNWGATARASNGEDADGIEFFEKAIRPVLAERCSSCHGARVAKPKGGLVLETRETMLKGGDSGPAIVPGDPESSRLIQAIRYDDESLRMPPKRRLRPGGGRGVRVLGQAWCAGAGDAPGLGKSAATSPATSIAITGHSSRRKNRPSPRKTPPRVPIDAFLRAELDTTRSALGSLRRSADPHPPRDVRPDRPAADAGRGRRFLADRSPDAFAKVVDRLLASPRYGERWARHWLDLVRYTDEFDEVWRYRDWVVRAFNDDLPYDRFIVNQIAGDQPPCTGAWRA